MTYKISKSLAILTASTAMLFPAPALANSPPYTNTDYVSLPCNSGNGYHVVSNDGDPDGDPLTLVSATSHGGINVQVGSASEGVVVIGSTAGPGNYSAEYVISDGQGNTATGYISVTVTAGGPYCHW